MSTTAALLGSFPSPGDQAVVAPVFDSFARDGAPQDEPSAGPRSTSAISRSFARLQQVFDRWTESNAQSRADADLREIARSDPRIMSDLMHAGMRDDSEQDNLTLVMSVPVAALAEEAPMRRQPRTNVAGQGWGRMIQDAYQHRFHQPRHDHA
jgi:hypothetical protein